MKKILPIIIIPAMMAACGSRADIASENLKAGIASDTTGFAQFQAWKQYHESNPNTFVIPSAKKSEKGNTDISSDAGENMGSHQNDQVTSGKGSVDSNTDIPTMPKEKKGWSKAAKGAAIGAGSGAVIGAVVNKRNRVVGAVVGGVVGGGVGYGIGRGMDKRDGRY